MIRTVVLSRHLQKELRRLPKRIVTKLRAWVVAVQLDGLENVRRLTGYHDEPLKGTRLGERSIRLSHQYRAIYSIQNDGMVEFARVEEVNAHDY